MKNQEIDALDLQGWPIADSFLIELGRVASLWASLEQVLNISIGKLTGFEMQQDPKWLILVTHSSFPQRLDAFGALCEIEKTRFPNLAAHPEVVSKLREAQRLRNRFLHNQMGPDPATGQITLMTSSARGVFKFGNEKIELADIRRAAIAIDDGSRSLWKLVFQRDIPPIWQRKKNGNVWE